MKRAPFVLLFSVLTVWSAGSAAPGDDPNVGAHVPSQAAADVLREFSSADAAFLAAGLIKPTFQKDDLATMLEYPGDTIVVLELTGLQVRRAFERSVSQYPQPNVGFLQIAGFEVTFNRNAAADSRVTSVTANGAKLDDAHTYTVAMPTSLQRGQLGYSNLWDKAKIVRAYEKTALASVLKGHRAIVSSPRWLAQP